MGRWAYWWRSTNRAALDEGGVRQAVVGDEDVRGEEEAEGDDGDVPHVQLPEERA